MSIGDIAKSTGRSVHALRWYEREGLIPGVSRDGGKRRVYRKAHIGWLRFLGRLNRTGMTVQEMKTYAALTAKGGSTAAERKAMLVRHRERLDAEIATLGEARQILDLKIAFYSEWARTGCRPPEPEIPPTA
ncbi:MAG: MerR family transcriptional regulator [Novosphingobium sp.]